MILCLETSGKACSVALALNGTCIAYKEAEGEWSHSKLITVMIEEALQDLGASVQDIAAAAVSSGPGSYTGLRVGTSCAKAICYAQDIPLLSVPTLEIIASEVIEDSLLESELVVPMIDARRMEVYYNLYTSDLFALQETTNLIVEKGVLSSYVDKKLVICGDGAFKMEALLPDYTAAEIVSNYAKASSMAGLAHERLTLGEVEDTAYFTPFYLKPPNITKSTKSLF